ncbi:acyl-CoA desaturase [Thermomonospora echinospora]|nr:acyl-CoA desaturase [Thermomonospora echinospora]
MEDEESRPWERILIGVFITVPLLAVAAAVPVAWGWGLGWRDVVITAVLYLVTGFGITAGYHRHFTHGSFKAPRPVRYALGIAGSMALEGPITRWVADHRKHHRYSDRDGDPHSPWKYGRSPGGLVRGLLHAHMGWMFDKEQTPKRRYAPDLLADRDVALMTRLFPLWVAISLLLPAVVGGLWSWSWQGALSGFFWGGLVRIGLIHQVTWSVNSLCHVFGKRQFATRDRSTNVWWLALPSLGESWHNLHHALATSARHGVLRGQLDPSAALIRLLERLRLAYDVRWPDPARVAAKRLP